MNQELKNELVQCYKEILQNMKLFHRTLVKAGIITEDFAVSSGTTNIKPHRIVELVMDVFETDVLVNNRKRTTVYARKACAYILRKYTELSLAELAPLIGVKDHSTVIYNVKCGSELMDSEDWFREKVLIIEDDIEKYNNFVRK